MIDGGLPRPDVAIRDHRWKRRAAATSTSPGLIKGSRSSTTASTGTAALTRCAATASAPAALLDVGWVVIADRVRGCAGTGRGNSLPASTRSFVALALRERPQIANNQRRVVYRHGRSRRKRPLGAGADVARRAGAQIVDVFRWGACDFGGIGHHAEVARRRDAALPRVDHVQPGEHRIGGGVRRQCGPPGTGSSCGRPALSLPSGRGSSRLPWSCRRARRRPSHAGSSTTVASAPSQPMSSPPNVSRQPCSHPVPAIGEWGARCSICSGCMFDP